jgi:hypothetical protein
VLVYGPREFEINARVQVLDLDAVGVIGTARGEELVTASRRHFEISFSSLGRANHAGRVAGHIDEWDTPVGAVDADEIAMSDKAQDDRRPTLVWPTAPTR